MSDILGIEDFKDQKVRETLIDILTYEMEKPKKEMKRKIDKMIIGESLRTGKIGDEDIQIRFDATDEEIEILKSIDFNKHFSWEIKKNEIFLTWTVEI